MTRLRDQVRYRLNGAQESLDAIRWTLGIEDQWPSETVVGAEEAEVTGG